MRTKTIIGNIEVSSVFGENSWETIKAVIYYARENNLPIDIVCELCGWNDGDVKQIELKDGRKGFVYFDKTYLKNKPTVWTANGETAHILEKTLPQPPSVKGKLNIENIPDGFIK